MDRDKLSVMLDDPASDIGSRLMRLQLERSARLDSASPRAGSTNWKENFVESSPSHRRYLLQTDGNDFINISSNMPAIVEESTPSHRRIQSEKSSFPQDLFNWTVNDSVAETKMNVASMRADLNKLVRDEDEKRKEHNHNRGNLQEAWDKLVQLRTHISLFKSAIEEATIEDVSLQAERGTWQSSVPDTIGNRILTSADSAIRLGEVQNIRDKVRLKENLKMKVGVVEELLCDLRTQLSHHSLELTRVNNTADRLSVSDSIGASMIMRQAVISISLQLEDAEK